MSIERQTEQGENETKGDKERKRKTQLVKQEDHGEGGGGRTSDDLSSQ